VREVVLYARNAETRWDDDQEHGLRLIVQGRTYAGRPLIAYLMPMNEDDPKEGTFVLKFGVPLESGAYVDTWTFTRAPPPLDEVDVQLTIHTAVRIEPAAGDRISALPRLGGCIREVEMILKRFGHLFPPPVEPLDLTWVRETLPEHLDVG